MNRLSSNRDENKGQKIEDLHEPEKKEAPAEEQIPVPPTEEVPSPIKEPVEDDKPTNPIIDEEKNRAKLIV
jgi:hypothetical protein